VKRITHSFLLRMESDHRSFDTLKQIYMLLRILFIIVPKLGLSKLNDNSLDGYVQDKVDALTDNDNFVTTDPTLVVVNTALTDYRSKLSLAQERTPANVAAKDASRDDLEEKVTLLALDVARQSNGDIPKFLTSHFDYRQQGSATPPLDVPQNFKLSFTKYEGELKAGSNAVKNASSYEIRLTQDPSQPVKDWELVMTGTSSKVIFTGLESGKRYYGTMRVIGSRGKISDWSDQADKICP